MARNHFSCAPNTHYVDTGLVLVKGIQHYLKDIGESTESAIIRHFIFFYHRACYNMSRLLTCPPPFSLLVSLTLLKETAAFIQCAPKFGESGWMYTQLGV